MADVVRLPAEKAIFQIPTDKQIAVGVEDYEIWDADRESVIRYLRTYPALLPFLPEARNKIRDYYGASATANLSVSVDPELDDDRKLWLWVFANLSPDELVETDERFQDDWWLDIMLNVGDWIHIATTWRESE